MQRRRMALGAGSAVLIALLARPAWAQQEDSGEFTILQARYGTENNHVDVTRQLRELARQDRRFQLTNDLFGVDPDPGRQKTLRLFVRDRQGQERYVDFRERDWIEGAQFVGWGGGNWGESNGRRGWQGDDRGGRDERRDQERDSGDYTILQAHYGTENNHVDVTRQLRELARQDRRFQLTNDLFGVDPDPGRQKTLRLYVRDRQGQERYLDFRERDWIEGAQFIGWGGGNWGESNDRRGWQGHDRGGRDERHDQDRDSGEFTILYATYGTARREVDVTDRLRELARRDVSFRLTNEAFRGVDPDPGRTKRLRIVARDRAGQQRNFDYREYQTVDGSQFIGWGRGDWGRRGDRNPNRGNSRLVIESASYGNASRRVDVTQQLRAMVRGGTLEVEVRNEVLGVDPAPGQRKTLSVTYRLGNQTRNTVQVSERDVMRLP